MEERRKPAQTHKQNGPALSSVVSVRGHARRWRPYVAAGIALALGHAQANDKGDRASRAQAQGAAYERGTDSLPVIVKVQGADTPEKRATDHADDVKRHDVDQRWSVGIGIVSIVAAFAQVAVLIGQIAYLRRTVRDSEKAIDAANSAANAANRQAAIAAVGAAVWLAIVTGNLWYATDRLAVATDELAKGADALQRFVRSENPDHEHSD